MTRDVDLKKSDNDKVTAKFTLAVNRRFKNANGEIEADFPSCVAFGKTAEFINSYFKKGSAIAVVGRIQTGSYKKDNTTVYTTDVVVDEAEFVESKREQDGAVGSSPHGKQSPQKKTAFEEMPEEGESNEENFPF